MKITLKIEKEVEVKILSVRAEVRYWEDGSLGEQMPCKKEDLWCPEIEIETGKILNWEQGKKADVHYKVCDCCGWDLINENREIVFSVENEYVPNSLSPKENGYGDYIIMDIDENGIIKDWNFNADDFVNIEN
jgi:hypothetical protein